MNITHGVTHLMSNFVDENSDYSENYIVFCFPIIHRVYIQDNLLIKLRANALRSSTLFVRCTRILISMITQV